MKAVGAAKTTIGVETALKSPGVKATALKTASVETATTAHTTTAHATAAANKQQLGRTAPRDPGDGGHGPGDYRGRNRDRSG
jgi:hypothetical protein